MTELLLPAKRYVALLAVLAGLFLIPLPTPAEPKLAKQDRLVAQMVCEFLQARPPEPARDRRRCFAPPVPPFPQGPRSRQALLPQERHRRVQEAGNRTGRPAPQGRPRASPTRSTSASSSGVEERQKLIEEFVAAKHDFDAKEYLDTDSDAIDYATHRRRGARALAQADQVRPADAAGRRQAGPGGRGQEEGAQPLPERAQALEAGGQRRSAGDLPDRPDRQHRPALDLHVADHAGRLRDRACA